MEEDTLEKCLKLFKAYKRLITKDPNVSTEYVLEKVYEASDTYMDILKNSEFAKDMIGRVIYHIIELETERMK
ncbi:MAG: hypothetical protein ACI3T9_02170 [Romboutsia timonensis]